MIDKKPQQVVLWGVGDFAASYLGYLQEAGIAVAFCVDLYVAGSDFFGHSVINPEQYAAKLAKNCDLPVVITGRSKSGKECFADILQYLVSELPRMPDTVLHPVFLVDYVSLDYSGRVYASGVPGSGNTIGHTLISAIVGAKKIELGEKEALFSQLAYEHRRLTIATLRNHYCCAQYEQAYAGSYGDLEFSLFTGKSCLLMKNISQRDLFHDVVRSHRAPKANMQLYQQKQYTAILYQRNPLDMLMSWIFKLDMRALQQHSDIDYNSISNSGLKHLLAIRILGNLDCFEQHAQFAADFFHELLDLSPIFALRYEELITKPVATLQTLAGHLGSDLDEPTATALWKQYGFKPLVAGNLSHFNAPNRKKYEHYFEQKHYDILNRLGYREIMAELGYEYDPTPAPQHPFAQFAESIDSPTFDRCIGGVFGLKVGAWPQYQQIDCKRVIRNLPVTDSIRVSSDSFELLNLSRSLFDSAYRRAVFTSVPLA